MSFIKLPQYFWQLSSARFNLIYALFVMAAYNIPFINAVYEKDRSFVAAALIVVCIFLVLNIALSVLFIRPLVKPLAIVFCLLNASALYFMNAYGVVIDKIMLMNVIQTDVYEVADLLNLKMALYLILLGIIPSYLIYKTDIAFKPLKADAQGKLTQGLIFALVAGGIIGGGLLHNPDTLKEHKHLKNALIPVNYIGAVISVVKIKGQILGNRIEDNFRRRPHAAAKRGKQARPDRGRYRRIRPRRQFFPFGIQTADQRTARKICGRTGLL